MKKQLIKIISTILLCITLVAVFSGCDLVSYGNHIFPDGYTCGIHIEPGSKQEYWWVETYDECIEAIEMLRINGSTFADDIVLAPEEDLFDVKYCFAIVGDDRRGERIKFGENPFDRWAYDVIIYTYVFLDNVTIDELVYSDVGLYNAYKIHTWPEYQEIINNDISKDELKTEGWRKALEVIGASVYIFNVYHNDILAIRIRTCFYLLDEEYSTIINLMNDELIGYIIESKRIIDPNNMKG